MLQPVILVSIHGQTSGVTRMLSVNKSNSFASDIKVPTQCQLSTDFQMSIKWVVRNARTGDILLFPPSFSDSAQSYTLPPHMLQPGFSYLVSIDVVVAVGSSGSLSQSECSCPQGLIKVNGVFLCCPNEHCFELLHSPCRDFHLKRLQLWCLLL
jgi:hypothetical protein